MENFNWENNYPMPRAPLFAENIVATTHPLAAQTGLKVLTDGGNAVDAAIAAAAMLTVVEPVSCGLGGDAFAMVWDGEKLHGLNASGCSPEGWNLDYFRKKYGDNPPKRGVDSVTIPGVIAGWSALHTKFGKLGWGELLSYARKTAVDGFCTPSAIALKWSAAGSQVSSQTGFKEVFMPQGRFPQTGELFTNKSIAKTFDILINEGAESFYKGEIAELLAKFIQAEGGVLTAKDLYNYAPEWVAPISVNYRGYDVHEMPPGGQGIAALIALGILNEFDLKEFDVDSPRSVHIQLEAMKMAFNETYKHVADSSYMQKTTDEMLSPDWFRQKAKEIDINKATVSMPQRAQSGGTVYLTVADKNGMMVSFIQSNYMGFGSGLVLPEYGISLQNRGAGFSMDKTSPNVVAPLKKPFHTIIPAFLSKDGRPVMSFGVMGGDMQPQGHVQTIVRMLDYNQQPQAACDAPRWKVEHGGEVSFEGRFLDDFKNTMSLIGHRLHSENDAYMDFGAGQFIWRMSGEKIMYIGASDSRRDGLAAGF